MRKPSHSVFFIFIWCSVYVRTGTSYQQCVLMHSTREFYVGAPFYTEKVTDVHVCPQLFISATLVVNALLLRADNISFPSLRLFLSPFLSLTLSLSSPWQLRPDCLFCLVEHFLPQILHSSQSLSISVTPGVSLQCLLRDLLCWLHFLT